MSSGVGHRHVSDLALLWPWCTLAAVALTRPLAWERPYAAGEALKKKQKSKKQNQKKPRGIQEALRSQVTAGAAWAWPLMASLR